MKRKKKRDVFYYLSANLGRLNQSPSCLEQEQMCYQQTSWPADMEVPLAAQQVLACGQNRGLGNTCSPHIGGNTQFVMFQIIPAFKQQKQQNNKNQSTLLMSGDGNSHSCRVHRRGWLLLTGHHVSSRETRVATFLSLGPTPRLWLCSAPSSPLRAGTSPRPSPLPPLPLPTAPLSPKALAHPGFTQLGKLNIYRIKLGQRVKKSSCVVDSFQRS